MKQIPIYAIIPNDKSSPVFYGMVVGWHCENEAMCVDWPFQLH